jgi:hypothetical protein
MSSPFADFVVAALLSTKTDNTGWAARLYSPDPCRRRKMDWPALASILAVEFSARMTRLPSRNSIVAGAEWVAIVSPAATGQLGIPATGTLEQPFRSNDCALVTEPNGEAAHIQAASAKIAKATIFSTVVLLNDGDP